MHGYLIERLSISNLSHLQTLYLSVYSKKVSMEFLVGKYNTKLFKAEWLGYLAFTSDRKPAAFFGVIPCHFKINNEIFLAAQAVDGMTSVDHRMKGLFTRLVKKTHELAAQEGIQFIFGFPNQNSYAGLMKLDWKFMPKPMQFFVLKGSKFPLAALLLKIPFLKNIYKQIVERDLSMQNKEVDLSSENGVIRDSLFIQYKNQYTKTFVKKWDNVYAWMKNDGALKIGLLNLSANASPGVIEDHLKHTANALGCRSIILMTSSNTQLYGTLNKIIPSRDGLPIGFYNLTDRDIDISQATFEYCDIDIF